MPGLVLSLFTVLPPCLTMQSTSLRPENWPSRRKLRGVGGRGAGLASAILELTLAAYAARCRREEAGLVSAPVAGCDEQSPRSADATPRGRDVGARNGRRQARQA